jgi:hypothetical protein
VQGILFLIPPITFFYMANHWKKLKRPTERVLGPLLTIGLVVAAFMFIPSLSGEGPGANDLKGRLRSSVEDIGRSIEGKASRLKSIDLKSLATPPPADPSPAADDAPNPLQKLESKVQGAKEMIRDQAEQIQRSAQPE